MAEYVRLLNERIIEGDLRLAEYAATDGATLPTDNLVTGSLAFIVGGKVKMFDEETGAWTDYADFGGGGSSAATLSMTRPSLGSLNTPAVNNPDLEERVIEPEDEEEPVEEDEGGGER